MVRRRAPHPEPLAPRRDRRGRGPRGPLAWPPVPAMTSRSARFDTLVLDAVHLIEQRLGRDLSGLEVAVEEVPPADPAPWESGIPLGRLFPAQGALAPRVVIYRRPVEARAQGDELGVLVHEVVLEQVATLLGADPEDLA